MTAAASSRLHRVLADYGMVFVLLLLCGFFSVVTWSEQRPTGAAAGTQLADDIAARVGTGSAVLIATQVIPQDAAFAEALKARLTAKGLIIAGIIKGEPTDARAELTRLAAAPGAAKLAAIACTEATAGWLALQDAGADFPALGTPLLMKNQAYSWPKFLNPDNLMNIANQIAVIAIVAVGMTMVIIAGGIDLSVGSLIALSAVVSALLIRNYAGGPQAGTLGIVLGCAGGIVVCALAGAFTGTLITRFGIPPFITTLSMMLMLNGLAYTLADHQTIYQVPDSFVWLGRGADLFGLPNAVVLMLILYGIAHVVMSHFKLGRHLYAVGGNREAARISGIPVGAVLLSAYTLSGLLAGVGGVVTASLLKSGSPTFGQTYEMYVIAAVVVGGTSLSGGRGRMFGTLIGAFIIAVIQNGMNLTNIESDMQKIFLGAVIVIAVLLDRLKQHGWRGLGNAANAG